MNEIENSCEMSAFTLFKNVVCSFIVKIVYRSFMKFLIQTINFFEIFLLRKLCRNHAEITQKLWPWTLNSCRAHWALAGVESNYANYSNHANDIIMQIINVPCILGIMNIYMQFMLGDPDRFPEPIQV